MIHQGDQSHHAPASVEVEYTPERLDELNSLVKSEAQRREELETLGRSQEAQQAREEVASRAHVEPHRDDAWTRAFDKVAAELLASRDRWRAEHAAESNPSVEISWPSRLSPEHFMIKAEEVHVSWMPDKIKEARAHLIRDLICPHCDQTGYVITPVPEREGYTRLTPCVCHPWRKVLDEYARAGLPASAGQHLLNSINWDLIEAQRLKQCTLAAPYWIAADLHNETQRVTLGGDHDGSRRFGILFFGHSGTAKSHIIQGLITEAIFAGKRARWVHWPHLLRRMKATFAQGASEGLEQVFSWATSTDVLAIEEIGGEKITDWAREQLEAMLTKCEDNGITLLISTNYNRERLIYELGGAAVSRIQGLCEIVRMRGRDYRAMSPVERHLGL